MVSVMGDTTLDCRDFWIIPINWLTRYEKDANIIVIEVSSF